MDDFEPKFTQTQAFAAAGVQRNRGLMWFKAGHARYVEADGDQAPGDGLAARLSARTAIRFALMDQLSTFMDVGKTGPAVSKFMDSTSGPDRAPGGLFENGETVLCVFEDGSAEVVCVESGTSALSLPGLRDGKRVAFLPLNNMHATVLGRLDRMAVPPFFEARKVGSVRLGRKMPAKVDA